jgi:hypothetical protein
VQHAQALLHFAGRQQGVERAQLLYMHRETGAGPFVYHIEYDPVQGRLIEMDLESLRMLVDQERAPEVPAGQTSFSYPCWYKTKAYEVHCPYWGHCWSGGDGHG